MINIMTPYILLILFVAFLQFKNKSNNDKKSFIIAMLVLFSFAAFRGNGSGDYFTYIEYSKYITSLDMVFASNFPMEIGFRIISYFVNITSLHQQFVIIIMNAISIACIGIFIKRHSSNKILSVFLFLPFYLQFDMHTARTAVAIGISVLSFQYIIDKKIIKFIIIVLLASAFHVISLAVLIIYLFKNIKFDIKIGLFMIAASMIIVSVVSIDETLVSLFDVIGLREISLKYLAYVSNKSYGYAFSLFDPRLLISIGIYILAKLRLTNPNKSETLLINITWLSAIVMVMLHEHTIFVIRASSFFAIYTIILIPMLLRRIKDCVTLKIEKFKIFTYKKISEIKGYYLFNTFVVLFFTAYTAVLLYRNAVEYKLFFTSPFEIRFQEFLNINSGV